MTESSARDALTPSAGTSTSLSMMGNGPVNIVMVPGSCRILNSVMNCPAKPLFCVVSQASPACDVR